MNKKQKLDKHKQNLQNITNISNVLSYMRQGMYNVIYDLYGGDTEDNLQRREEFKKFHSFGFDSSSSVLFDDSFFRLVISTPLLKEKVLKDWKDTKNNRYYPQLDEYRIKFNELIEKFNYLSLENIKGSVFYSYYTNPLFSNVFFEEFFKRYKNNHDLSKEDSSIIVADIFSGSGNMLNINNLKDIPPFIGLHSDIDKLALLNDTMYNFNNSNHYFLENDILKDKNKNAVKIKTSNGYENLPFIFTNVPFMSGKKVYSLSNGIDITTSLSGYSFLYCLDNISIDGVASMIVPSTLNYHRLLNSFDVKKEYFIVDSVYLPIDDFKDYNVDVSTKLVTIIRSKEKILERPNLYLEDNFKGLNFIGEHKGDKVFKTGKMFPNVVVDGSKEDAYRQYFSTLLDNKYMKKFILNGFKNSNELVNVLKKNNNSVVNSYRNGAVIENETFVDPTLFLVGSFSNNKRFDFIKYQKEVIDKVIISNKDSDESEQNVDINKSYKEVINSSNTLKHKIGSQLSLFSSENINSIKIQNAEDTKNLDDLKESEFHLGVNSDNFNMTIYDGKIKDSYSYVELDVVKKRLKDYKLVLNDDFAVFYKNDIGVYSNKNFYFFINRDTNNYERLNKFNAEYLYLFRVLDLFCALNYKPISKGAVSDSEYNQSIYNNFLKSVNNRYINDNVLLLKKVIPNDWARFMALENMEYDVKQSKYVYSLSDTFRMKEVVEPYSPEVFMYYKLMECLFNNNFGVDKDITKEIENYVYNADEEIVWKLKDGTIINKYHNSYSELVKSSIDNFIQDYKIKGIIIFDPVNYKDVLANKYFSGDIYNRMKEIISYLNTYYSDISVDYSDSENNIEDVKVFVRNYLLLDKLYKRINFDDIVDSITLGDRWFPLEYYASFLSILIFEINALDNNSLFNSNNSSGSDFESYLDNLLRLQEMLSSHNVSDFIEMYKNQVFNHRVDYMLIFSLYNIKDLSKVEGLSSSSFSNKFYLFYNDKVDNYFFNSVSADSTDHIESLGYNFLLEYDDIKGKSAINLIEYFMNNKSPVFRIKDSNGNFFPHKKKNLQFQLLKDKTEKRFVSFLKSLPQKHKDKIENIFNNNYNVSYNKDIDFKVVKPYIDSFNHSNYILRDSQYEAIVKVLTNCGGLVNMPVGSGKTLVSILTSNILSQIYPRFRKKHLFLMRNANIEQAVIEYKKVNPNKRILYLRKKDMTTNNVYKMLNIAKTSNVDAIFMSHFSFRHINVGFSDRLHYYEEQRKDLIDSLLFDPNSNDEKTSKIPVNKMIYRHLSKLDQILKKLTDEYRKVSDSKNKNFVSFEDLGINHIVVDESQVFKNLPYVSKNSQLSGLPNMLGSQRALRLFFCIRHLQRIHADKNFYPMASFYSGTPVENSVAELFFIFKNLYSNVLKEKKIFFPDAFFNMFCIRSVDYDINFTGKIISKSRFRGFKNLFSLLHLYKNYCYVKTIDDIPDVKNLLPKYKIENVIINPNESLKSFNKEIIYSLEKGFLPEKYYDKKITPKFNNGTLQLVAMSLCKPMNIDVRTLTHNDDSYYDPTQKLGQIVDKVKIIYDDTILDKGAQIIFVDVVKTFDNGFNVFYEIKNRLVAKGVLSNEIELSKDIVKDEQFYNVADKVNKGEIRILITSMHKFSTGVNMQRKGVAIHFANLDWKPAIINQALGRFIRQGNDTANNYGGVKIFMYLNKGSIDVMMANLLAIKDKFIKDIDKGLIKYNKYFVEDIGSDESVNFEELRAVLSGDNRLLKLSKNRQQYSNCNVIVNSINQKIVNAKNVIENKRLKIKKIMEKLFKADYFYFNICQKNDFNFINNTSFSVFKLCSKENNIYQKFNFKDVKEFFKYISSKEYQDTFFNFNIGNESCSLAKVEFNENIVKVVLKMSKRSDKNIKYSVHFIDESVKQVEKTNYNTFVVVANNRQDMNNFIKKYSYNIDKVFVKDIFKVAKNKDQKIYDDDIKESKKYINSFQQIINTSKDDDYYKKIETMDKIRVECLDILSSLNSDSGENNNIDEILVVNDICKEMKIDKKDISFDEKDIKIDDTIEVMEEKVENKKMKL